MATIGGDAMEKKAKQSDVPTGKLNRKDYEKQLAHLQSELVQMQLWVKQAKAKIVVLFEGRDAAGKGGVIKRITERTSPRVFRVVALPVPSERQQSQIFAQRYIERFPAGGEVCLFDRSWYNRAGVDWVMGFATEVEYDRFLRLVPMVEEAFIAGGIQIIKYWFEVSQDEQTRRFKDRAADPRKIWKLSPMDLESHRRWYDYSRARDAMFRVTDTEISPWYVVKGDDKRRARLNCITHLLDQVPYQRVEPHELKLPGRQKSHGYVEPDYPWRFVPELY
jgi:polyphosphate kinase 2